jgi:hypothetical protein
LTRPARRLRIAHSSTDALIAQLKSRDHFNETQEALRQQTATADVLRAISRTAFDLDTVLETGARDVSKKPL